MAEGTQNMKKHYGVFSKLISVILTAALLCTMLPGNLRNVSAAAVTTEATISTGNEVNEGNTTTAAILGEAADKREQFVKHYLLEDGTYKATVFPAPVHYMKEGKWEDIDNSLSQVTDSVGTYYENKGNSFKVMISTDVTSDRLINIKNNGYEISWSFDNAKGTTVKSVPELKDPPGKKAGAEAAAAAKDDPAAFPGLASGLEFADASEGTGLQYYVGPDSIKENIIIKSKTDKPVYTFSLKADGLKAELKADRSILFMALDGSLAFKMNAPYMFDGKGVRSESVLVTLEKTDSGYRITFSPDKVWLNDKDRVYPVTLDPWFSIGSNSYVSNYMVTSQYPWYNYSANSVSYGSQEIVYYKVILPQLDTGDYVSAAYLVENLISCTSTAEIDICKVTSTWDPSALSYINQPSSTYPADYVKQAAWTYGDPESEYYLETEWNISPIVKSWYDGNPNYGLVKFHMGTMGTAWYESSAGSWYYGPAIYIYYANSMGLESYYTYHSQNLGRAGTGNVCDCNGNLVYVHDDITESGRRLPTVIRHVYNSGDSGSELGFGMGWRLNISQKIDTVELPLVGGSQTVYRYTDGDGTSHYFNGCSGGTDESGLGLTVYPYSNGYVIYDRQDNQMYFNWNGDLYMIKDNENNTLTISYSYGMPYTITDGAGRSMTLSYQNGRLSGITDPAGRSTSYAYTSGTLTSVTYPDSTVSSFAYDAGYRMTSATDSSGYMMVYTYYGSAPYRIQQVKETHTGGTLGQEINITYGFNTTSFTDVSGNKSTYQFNNRCNTVSMTDAEGNALYCKYYTGTNVTNKLMLESKLQRSIMNYLKDHNVEAGTGWTSETSGGSTGSFSISTAQKYMGAKSLCVVKTNTAGRHYWKQQVTLTKGKTYTLSGYLKTESITSSSGKGAFLYLSYQDSSGTWQIVDSGYVSGTNSWDRYEVSFTLPSNAYSQTVYAGCGIAGETGTAYFDCLQLENGSLANRYNLVENADLAYGTDTPSFWTKSADCTSSDTLIALSDSTYPPVLDNKCFRMYGAMDKNKSLSQMIVVSGNAGDVIVAGGWAKGISVPQNTSLGRYFRIEVIFYMNGSPYMTKTLKIPFNEDNNNWNYVSDRIIADYWYDGIKFNIQYANNLNFAYFDGLQLYKEEFGTSFAYDTNGNPSTIVDLANRTSNILYSSNNPVRYTSPGGYQYNYTFDTKHNMTQGTTPEGIVSAYTYDSYGNMLTATTGSSPFIKYQRTYLNGNYVSTETDPSGNVVTYGYNQTKGLLTSVTDPKSKVASYTYNANNDMLTGVSKTANSQTVSNSYGYTSNRLSSVTHNSFSYNFSYDVLGNMTQVAAGAQALVTNTYESRTSRLLTASYGNGQNTGYTYDTYGKLTTISSGGNAKYKYTYDGSGNLGSMEDLVNSTTFRYIYDLADRLVKIRDSSGNTSTFSYDIENNVSGMTEKLLSGTYTTGYLYDTDRRPTRVNAHNGSYMTYAYDTLNRLALSVVNTGSTSYTTSFSYLAGAGGSSAARLGTITNAGSAISYTYDANGNISTITQGSNSIQYFYDELNEVIRENNQVLNKTITYSYDIGGNITAKTEYAYTTGTPSNPTKTYTYTYDSTWKDKLASYDGKSITYDAIGNPLTYDGWTYSWQMGRQLASASKTGTAATYKYNDAGIRTEKIVNSVTTKYHLINGQVTCETNNAGYPDTIYYTYSSAGAHTAMTLNGTTYYYIRNGQGDITGLFDSSGTQVVSYTYDTWGRLISTTGSLASTVGLKNPYRYRGYRYDVETGLYYCQSRYYNPEWVRWLNVDSYMGKKGDLLSHNLFAYCQNNPVNTYDPNGLFVIAIPIFIIYGVYITFVGIMTYILIQETINAVYATHEYLQYADSDDAEEYDDEFKDKLDNVEENPEDWVKTGENSSDSTKKGNKGGKSIEEEYTNRKTGEKIWKHTITDKSGRIIVKPHFRPWPKQ